MWYKGIINTDNITDIEYTYERNTYNGFSYTELASAMVYFVNGRSRKLDRKQAEDLKAILEAKEATR